MDDKITMTYQVEGGDLTHAGEASSGVKQSLRKLGKSVPEDVLMCGFDDAPESRIMTPTLTTVHNHTQIMAFTAIHLLMTRMKEPTLDYRTVYTATELIYRDSTKC